jgi:hypothetical protein
LGHTVESQTFGQFKFKRKEQLTFYDFSFKFEPTGVLDAFILEQNSENSVLNKM